MGMVLFCHARNFREVSKLFQGSFKCELRKFLGCFKEVSRVFQGWFNEVLCGLQAFLKEVEWVIEGVSKVFQGCFKGSFRGVPRDF